MGFGSGRLEFGEDPPIESGEPSSKMKTLLRLDQRESPMKEFDAFTWFLTYYTHEHQALFGTYTHLLDWIRQAIRSDK